MKLYSRKEFINEGLIDTLKGTLPDISLRSNVNFWPSIIDDIKSGKLKDDALKNLPPSFVNDIKSGKITKDIIGEKPEILSKITNMFI